MAKKDWEAQLLEILKDYTEEELKTVDVVMMDVADDVRDKIEQSAKAKFGGSGKYAAGWKVERKMTKVGEVSYTIHNPEHYRLTHLLERGHQSKNQFGGPYKRVRGKRHIKPAETWGNEELIKRLEQKL